MSDEVYDADGDLSHYLQMTPSLESHVLALPDDAEPVVATHVVGGAPQHVPDVQGGVGVAVPTAAQTPLNLLSMAFGSFDVQSHHAMTTMDGVQPLQGQYGFPADQIRALPARLDDLPSFEPSLEHGALPELLATLSLEDHSSMDDGDYSVEALFKMAEDAGNNHSGAVAEHSVFPALNAAHTELELDMLKEILPAPSSNTFADEAVGVLESGREAPHQTVTRADQGSTNADVTMLVNAANWPVFSPAILESSHVRVQDHGMSSSSDANAPGSETLLAKQRRRISQMTMNDIANLMHMSKKDAAKELNISVTSLKRLCRKNNNGHWPARQIKSLDSQIKKLELAARRNGFKGLLAIKEKIDKLQSEKTQVYASVLKAIHENKKHNSAGGSSC